MAPPPAKKRKARVRNDRYSPEPPVVFNAPSMAPDTRLTAFESEFHVHSVLLRLNSAFFRKFIDEPGNDGSVALIFTNERPGRDRSANGLPTVFKYDWATEFDEGDEHASWQLVKVANLSENKDGPKTFPGDRAHEVLAFEKLLCTIYNKGYQIESSKEFKTMVKLADYYFMLPVMSRSLNGMFFKTPDFWKFVEDEPMAMLELAIKLHSPVLFNDALIFSMSPWHAPPWRNHPHGLVRSICSSAHHSLVDKISLIQSSISTDIALSLANHHHTNAARIRRGNWIASALENACVPGSTVPSANNHGVLTIYDYNRVYGHLAGFFRHLCETWKGHTTHKPSYVSDMEKVLQNKLMLGGKKFLAGKGDYAFSFLCAAPDNSKFPWDENAVDW